MMKVEVEDAIQSKKEECQNEMYNHEEGRKHQIFKQLMLVEQQQNDIQVAGSGTTLARKNFTTLLVKNIVNWC